MKPRRGFSMVLVVVVLGILSAIMAYVTAQTVMQRQSLLQRERRLQTRWLLRSGFDRALAKLQTSGESFDAEWKDFVPKSSIKATAKAEAKDRIQLRVEVILGIDHPQPVRMSETWNLKRAETGGVVRFELEEAKVEAKKNK